MLQSELKKAFRNAWILWAAAAVFIVLMSLFALTTNDNPPPPRWEMGGKSFVPASSPYANGYYSPVIRPGEGGAP